jgi:hypothetical protein
MAPHVEQPQYEPVEPRPDDGDEHDRNHPLITGQPARGVRREHLERDTTDDDHDIGRGVDTDPRGQ